MMKLQFDIFQLFQLDTHLAENDIDLLMLLARDMQNLMPVPVELSK